MTTRGLRRRTTGDAALATLLCVTLLGAPACSASATGEEVTSLAPPPTTGGRPPGTVTLPTRTDVASTVRSVQDAIAANGGRVLATIDNAADARAVGVTIPANTVVIGGSPAAGLPMLRANQQAAATLPERYLVRQEAGGAVSLVYNGPDYVAAVSGVVDVSATTPFSKATDAVADQAVDATGVHQSAPLIGTTPTGFLRIAPGNASVPATAERLEGAVTLADETLMVQDLAAGSAADGPALRATTVLLISAPAKTSPLVDASPTFGLELPLRFVVWLDDKNVTQIGYVDIGVLAVRHGLAVNDPRVVALAAECGRLAKIAAGG